MSLKPRYINFYLTCIYYFSTCFYSRGCLFLFYGVLVRFTLFTTPNIISWNHFWCELPFSSSSWLSFSVSVTSLPSSLDLIIVVFTQSSHLVDCYVPVVQVYVSVVNPSSIIQIPRIFLVRVLKFSGKQYWFLIFSFVFYIKYKILLPTISFLYVIQSWICLSFLVHYKQTDVIY